MDNQAEIKAARTRLRMTQQDMVEYLGLKNIEQYRSKESGKTKFSDSEKAMLTRLFRWDYETMNAILYNSQLPSFLAANYRPVIRR